MTKPKEDTGKKNRICLCCGKEFASTHWGNRLCGKWGCSADKSQTCFDRPARFMGGNGHARPSA